MPNLRLLKINVQPVFVIDDGESLTEQAGQVLTISQGQWDDFATNFISNVAKITDEYAANQESEQPDHG